MTTKQIAALYNKYLYSAKIDCVIGFFRPYSCLSAAMIIKKTNNRLKCISCYLDLVEPKDRPKFMPKVLYDKLLRRGERNVISESNFIMLPNSAKRCSDLIFNECPNVLYYEFPTFISNSTKKEPQQLHYADVTTEGNELIKMVFAGTMTKAYRSPEIMIEVIKNVSCLLNGYTIKLDVFGSCDCAEALRSCSELKNLIVNYHGRVPKEEVSSYEESANFLINIMNAYEAIVPSKIFELFASGKPILNFVSKGDDGSLTYFEKYPLAFTINWPDTSLDGKRSMIKLLHDFIIAKKTLTYLLKKFRGCFPNARRAT